jgi:hypothetical protein
MGTDVPVLAAVAQRQRRLQNDLDASRKLRPCPSDLDHLAAAAQQVGQASLMEGVHKLTIDTPSIAHQKSREVLAQHLCGLFKSTSWLDGIHRLLRTREHPHPPRLRRHFPASFIGGYARRSSNPFHQGPGTWVRPSAPSAAKLGTNHRDLPSAPSLAPTQLLSCHRAGPVLYSTPWPGQWHVLPTAKPHCPPRLSRVSTLYRPPTTSAMTPVNAKFNMFHPRFGNLGLIL